MSAWSYSSATPSVVPPTLHALAEQYRLHALKVRGVLEESAKAEAPYLRRFFEYFHVSDSPVDLFAAITPDTVANYLAWYAARYGRGSRCSMQNTLRLFLRFAYLCGYMGADLSSLSPSVRTWRMGKLARSIPSDCMETLVSSIGAETPLDRRDAAIICLLCTYGVRGVQIRRLRLEDIDWERSQIHFSAVKRGRSVEQHLTPKAGNRLTEYITTGRPSASCKEVFLTMHEPFRPIASPRELSKILRHRLEQAGIELPQGVAYGSHCFRHAFASRLYGRVPFKEIVDMLGHRDPSTTLRYGKVDVMSLQKAALPWPGGAP